MRDVKTRKTEVTDTAQETYTKNVFESREMAYHHHGYEEELRFFDYIKSGNVEAVMQAEDLFASEENGKLSSDPLRHIRYMFVASMTLITRSMMDKGMVGAEAYAISDSYIQKMDLCNTEEEIRKLHRQMTIDMTHRMREIAKDRAYSKAIVLCMDYIHEHLHENMELHTLANYVGLAPTYLSAVFKKETGERISDYIRNQRINAAKNMLRFSDYTYGEISSYLAFSSQSHFISLFKKNTGMTPRQYRQKYYRKNWEQIV